MSVRSSLKDEDVLFDEVLNPSVMWCKSGHHIPDNVKVYSVRGPALPKHLWGNYCELCVAGANKLAKRKKDSKSRVELQEEALPSISLNMLKAQLLRAGFVGGINDRDEQSTKEPWELFLEEIG